MKIFKSLFVVMLAFCAFAFSTFAKSPPPDAVVNQNMQIVIVGSPGVGTEILAARLASQNVGVIVVRDISENPITMATVKPPTVDARQILALESWRDFKTERQPFYVPLITEKFAATSTVYKSPPHARFNGFGSDCSARAKI